MQTVLICGFTQIRHTAYYSLISDRTQVLSVCTSTFHWLPEIAFIPDRKAWAFCFLFCKVCMPPASSLYARGWGQLCVITFSGRHGHQPAPKTVHFHTREAHRHNPRQLDSCTRSGTISALSALKVKGRDCVQLNRPTITPREAATYLEISEDTVVRWFIMGAIEGYRKTPSARGRIRLYRDSVEQFDRQRKSQTPLRKLKRLVSVRDWSGRRGSNPRPAPWQGAALPTEPLPRYLHRPTT
jgi:excisionase family DNA binding protein